MNCVEELNKAFLLAWVGDLEEAKKIARDCENELKDVKEVREKLIKVKGEVDYDFQLAKALREAKVETEDILRLALFALSKRLRKGEFKAEVKKEGNLIYSVIDIEFKKMLRGVIFNRKGYSYSLLNTCPGFFVAYNQIVYGEFQCNKVEDVVKEIVGKIRA
ncbi:MAG: hypothetical protein MPF33_09110 [Candidatus Aramenus sp.]|nr:hypothetical protein [Candidatus Aramenus sp.]